jgi:glycosyltransferase involved in cell wall biosynthesis
MRILYLLPAISHPSMRSELRHHHFLKNLAERHAVTLVALTRLPPSAGALRDLRDRTERLEIIDTGTDTAGACDRATAGLGAWRARVRKQQRWRRGIYAMRRAVSRLATSGRYDVVIAYGPDLCGAVEGAAGLPLVADICDAASVRIRDSLPYGNPLELPWRIMRWRRTAQAERWLLRRTPHVVFISERDRAAVEGERRTATVIPNGVDLDYWQMASSEKAPGTVVFSGTLDYPPNADAAVHLLRQVLPRLRARVPSATVVIAGRNPTPAVERAARDAGTVVTGAVDDLRPHLGRAEVFVAPLRFASGAQNKLLEAMSMSLPVVTSPVAARGFQLDGVGSAPLVVANTADEFADRAAGLLRDALLRERLAREGRAFVERHFAWRPNASRLEQVCLEAAHAGQRAVA